MPSIVRGVESSTNIRLGGMHGANPGETDQFSVKSAGTTKAKNPGHDAPAFWNYRSRVWL